MKLQSFAKGTILINFKFGVGDNVREVTNPDKVGSGPMSGRDATWGATYTGTATFLFFVFRFFNKATVHTREPILAHNSSKDAVWRKEDPFGDEKCVILKFGSVLP